MSEITLTRGHLARHTPRGAGAQGQDAAIVDIAQDLLLRDLHVRGVLDPLAFKGGHGMLQITGRGGASGVSIGPFARIVVTIGEVGYRGYHDPVDWP